MGASLPPAPVVTILLEEAPDFEFAGDLVYVVDRVDGQVTVRRAMRRSEAIRAFAKFAEKLREERIAKGAEIIQFPTEARRG